LLRGVLLGSEAKLAVPLWQLKDLLAATTVLLLLMPGLLHGCGAQQLRARQLRLFECQARERRRARGVNACGGAQETVSGCWQAVDRFLQGAKDCVTDKSVLRLVRLFPRCREATL
jgi:hypothetical protein